MLPSFRPLLARALAGICFFAPCGLSAQFTAAKVTFRNPGPYSQADLEQTARLRAGEKTSRDGIQAAAQRLMDTGCFDDVKVDSKGTPGALEVIFVLTPEAPGKETSVGFENFVWLTPEELQTVVQKAAPLFHGQLPEAGNQPDAIEAALQAALAGKGVGGKVTHETLEPSTTQPVRAIEYRVEPRVRVGIVTLTGVPAELAAAQDKLVQRLAGSAYNEGLAGETTGSDLLAPSRNAGYLQAKLDGLQRTVNASGRVDLKATLEPGPVYRVSAVAFAGTPLISSETASAAAKLHTGDIASRQRLLLTMQPIDDAYKKQGYMDVYVDPGETLDTAAHTVSYSLTVVPGEVYRVKSVTPLGLSPAAQAEFDKVWRMTPGSVYSADYVSHFIENNSAMRALATFEATFQAAADPNTRLVDLVVKFVPTRASPRR